jgi:hypothetical protein
MSEHGSAWLGEVAAWIGELVGSTAELEVIRERAWGVIVRVTTPDGVLFFKEPAHAGRQESVIVEDISSRWPGLVPEVVAADHERGWLLMHDHGSPMRDAIAPDDQLAVFEEILPRYSEMQRELRPFIEQWIAAGAPDRRLEHLPSLVDDLAAGHTRIGAIPLSADQRALVDAALRDLERIGDEFGMAAIDHSDMHDNNVLTGRGAPRVIDWGDSCISHPFASLFVVYQHAVARSAAHGRRDAALRLRDVYLDAWTQDASVRELRTAFAFATWLGYPIRALNFVHMMGEADFADCRKDVAQFLVRWTEKRALLADPDELAAAVADQTEY